MPNVKILIVEDDSIEAMDIKKQLEYWGYTVVSIADSGEEAVEKSRELKPDLILLDIVIKGDLNGVEVAEEISALDIPVIYVTAHSEDNYADRAKTTNPYGYIIKPIDMNELKRSIEFALYKHESERKIKESEEIYRSLFLKSDDAIFLTTKDGRILDANPAASKLFGYTIEEFKQIGRDALLKQTEMHIQDIGKDRTFEGKLDFEATHICKDGTEFPAEVSAALFKDHKGENKAFVRIKDITERKQIEDTLKKSETRYRRLFETAKDGILILDADTGQILDANPFIIDMLGYSREEIYKKKLWEIGLIKDTAKSKKAFLELQKEKYIRYEDLPLETKSGKEINVEFVSNQYEVNHRKVIQCNIRDITDRKKAEMALKESEERLRRFSEACFEGICIHDGGIIHDANHAFARMGGYELSEVLGKNIMEFAAPESHEIIMKNIKAGHEKPYRALGLRKDGTTFPVELNARSMPYKDGIVRITAFRDITDQVKFEEELKKIEERQRRLLEESFEGVIVQFEGKIHSINQEGTEILGAKSPEEIVGTPVYDIIHPDYHETIGERIKEISSTGLSVPLIEEKFVKLDGEVIDVEVVSTAYKMGDMQGVQTVFRDITKRKNAEEQLKKSLKEKDALLREVHHRVKNNLQIITSLLNLQSQSLRDDYDLEVFRETQNRVKSMALVYERLYQTQDFANINMAEQIKTLILNLCSSYHMDRSRVKLNTHIQDLKLGLDTAIPLSFLINELISNALKHAFPKGMNGEINIELMETGGKSYKLTISDNGVGFPEDLDFQKKETLGLRLVNILVGQLDGTIKLDKTRGTKFEIEFNEQIYKERK